jgi:hypothetical protein
MNNSTSDKHPAFFARAQALRLTGGEEKGRRLRPKMVPKQLWQLIPYAEFWGISDDSCRIELIKEAPAEIWSDFRKVIAQNEQALMDWLAGPEADQDPTPEYAAFSFMVQAFDYPRD